MANYVYNTVIFNAPSDERAEELINFLKSDRSDFDFNKIIPFPEELNGIGSGMTTINGVRTDFWKDEYFEDLSEQETKVLRANIKSNQECSPDMYGAKSSTRIRISTLLEESYKLELISKYGSWNWYDWNNKNIGTKSSNPSVDYNVENDEYTFETAWSPPTPLIERLSSLFPDIEFIVKWNEEQGFGEEYSIQDMNKEIIRAWDIPDINTHKVTIAGEETEYYECVGPNGHDFAEGYYLEYPQDGDDQDVFTKDEIEKELTILALQKD